MVACHRQRRIFDSFHMFEGIGDFFGKCRNFEISNAIRLDAGLAGSKNFPPVKGILQAYAWALFA